MSIVLWRMYLTGYWFIFLVCKRQTPDCKVSINKICLKRTDSIDFLEPYSSTKLYIWVTQQTALCNNWQLLSSYQLLLEVRVHWRPWSPPQNHKKTTHFYAVAKRLIISGVKFHITFFVLLLRPIHDKWVCFPDKRYDMPADTSWAAGGTFRAERRDWFLQKARWNLRGVLCTGGAKTRIPGKRQSSFSW